MRSEGFTGSGVAIIGVDARAVGKDGKVGGVDVGGSSVVSVGSRKELLERGVEVGWLWGPTSSWKSACQRLGGLVGEG